MGSERVFCHLCNGRFFENVEESESIFDQPMVPKKDSAESNT